MRTLLLYSPGREHSLQILYNILCCVCHKLLKMSLPAVAFVYLEVLLPEKLITNLFLLRARWDCLSPGVKRLSENPANTLHLSTNCL